MKPSKSFYIFILVFFAADLTIMLYDYFVKRIFTTPYFNLYYAIWTVFPLCMLAIMWQWRKQPVRHKVIFIALFTWLLLLNSHPEILTGHWSNMRHSI